jgi:hypothetical protein
MSHRASNWESTFAHEADVDHCGAHRRLACAGRALSTMADFVAFTSMNA